MINTSSFRSHYEPFVGKFHEFDSYRILETENHGRVLYTVKYGDSLLAQETDFLSAVSACRRHANR